MPASLAFRMLAVGTRAHQLTFRSCNGSHVIYVCVGCGSASDTEHMQGWCDSISSLARTLQTTACEQVKYDRALMQGNLLFDAEYGEQEKGFSRFNSVFYELVLEAP
ncbi:hypothetical protein VOLCADRAFT_88698 [Volvox carteri f. nagariensis]|uniref:Uncharacterized protein n=1 Tax=Volvox carteri f. nagariensis TaxID=3068 RepID=D8TPQ2_VOLCA|nr:uncharacterized protein VOLCADRAFT_88698 [Volvox carteri f. nagariensis]EFJ50654.1 hypothetical protein VOLCADRAFT_88698 [Volvox carteri f. nagariensis]|eukprot:XP_002948247.1 hypothetical protein VOLCADRAFT_88698 [Volvox carteri f. nagariensis]